MPADAPTPESLVEAVAEAPHGLSLASAARLVAYAEALATHEGPNLTSLKDVARITEVLLRPSLLIAWSVAAAPRRVADIGTGNGFPGVAAAALWPNADVLLVERRGHKANAVRALVEQTGFDNVSVVACDARELSREAPRWMDACDLVVLRAVGALAPTTRFCAPLLAWKGCLAHAKSATVDANERRQGLEMARGLGLSKQADVTQPHLATGRLIRYVRA